MVDTRAIGQEVDSPPKDQNFEELSDNQATKSPVKYFLVSTLVAGSHNSGSLSMKLNSTDGLLMLVLSFIYLNFGKLSKNSLHKYLIKFGFTLSNCGTTLVSNELGTLKSILELWIKRSYIVSELIAGADDKEQVDFKWGKRSLVEVPLSSIISFILMTQKLDVDDAALRKKVVKSGRRIHVIAI